jgi:hypothetical protein
MSSNGFLNIMIGASAVCTARHAALLARFCVSDAVGAAVAGITAIVIIAKVTGILPE